MTSSEKHTPEKHTPDKNIQGKIEHICQQGCSVVRQTIEVLEFSTERQQSNHSPQLSDLLRETTESQQQEILQELKTIMAVYDDKNCNDN